MPSSEYWEFAKRLQNMLNYFVNKVVSYASKSYATSRGDLIYRQEGSDIPVESYKKVIKIDWL